MLFKNRRRLVLGLALAIPAINPASHAQYGYPGQQRLTFPSQGYQQNPDYAPRVYSAPPRQMTPPRSVYQWGGGVVGGAVGTAAGGAAGAYVGGAAGAACCASPEVGAPVGAYVGQSAGRSIGQSAGSNFGGYVYDNTPHPVSPPGAQNYYYPRAYGIQTTTPYMVVPRRR